jgi:hypothetical protein
MGQSLSTPQRLWWTVYLDEHELLTQPPALLTPVERRRHRALHSDKSPLGRFVSFSDEIIAKEFEPHELPMEPDDLRTMMALIEFSALRLDRGEEHQRRGSAATTVAAHISQELPAARTSPPVMHSEPAFGFFMLSQSTFGVGGPHDDSISPPPEFHTTHTHHPRAAWNRRGLAHLPAEDCLIADRLLSRTERAVLDAARTRRAMVVAQHTLPRHDVPTPPQSAAAPTPLPSSAGGLLPPTGRDPRELRGAPHDAAEFLSPDDGAMHSAGLIDLSSIDVSMESLVVRHELDEGAPDVLDIVASSQNEASGSDSDDDIIAPPPLTHGGDDGADGATHIAMAFDDHDVTPRRVVTALAAADAFLSSDGFVSRLLHAALTEVRLDLSVEYVALATLARVMTQGYAVQRELMRLASRDPATLELFFAALVTFTCRHLSPTHGSSRVRLCGAVEDALTVLAATVRDVRHARASPIARRVALALLGNAQAGPSLAALMTRSTAACAAWAIIAFYGATCHGDQRTAAELCGVLADMLCSDGTCAHGPVSIVGACSRDADATEADRVAEQCLPVDSFLSDTDGTTPQRRGGALSESQRTVSTTACQLLWSWNGIVAEAASASRCVTAPTPTTLLHLTFAYLLAVADRAGFTTNVRAHLAHFPVLLPAVSFACDVMIAQDAADTHARLAHLFANCPRTAHWLHVPQFASDGCFAALLHCGREAIEKGTAEAIDTWRQVLYGMFTPTGDAGTGTNTQRPQQSAGFIAYASMTNSTTCDICACSGSCE